MCIIYFHTGSSFFYILPVLNIFLAVSHFILFQLLP